MLLFFGSHVIMFSCFCVYQFSRLHCHHLWSVKLNIASSVSVISMVVAEMRLNADIDSVRWKMNTINNFLSFIFLACIVILSDSDFAWINYIKSLMRLFVSSQTLLRYCSTSSRP